MGNARSEEGAPLAEAGHDRVEPLCAVDLRVEERVEEVEAADPERHRAAERPRLPRQAPGDGDPTAHGRESVDRAEPGVTEPREPLQVRIDHEARDRNRPEPADDVRELEDRDEEERE